MYLLNTVTSSKNLVRNNFISGDCTKDTKKRLKELFGRMIHNGFAINAYIYSRVSMIRTAEAFLN